MLIFVLSQLVLQVSDFLLAANSVFFSVSLLCQTLMAQHVILLFQLVERLLQLDHVLLVFLHLGLQRLVFGLLQRHLALERLIVEVELLVFTIDSLLLLDGQICLELALASLHLSLVEADSDFLVLLLKDCHQGLLYFEIDTFLQVILKVAGLFGLGWALGSKIVVSLRSVVSFGLAASILELLRPVPLLV